MRCTTNSSVQIIVYLFLFLFGLQAHVLSVKNVDSLPLPLIMATFVCCLQWLIYGYLLEDPFIQVWNNFQPQMLLGDRIFNPYATFSWKIVILR